MKKSIVTFLILCAAVSTSYGQSTLTSVNFNKIVQPALMLDLPYNEEVLQDFIVARLKKTGYSPETKGKFFWKQNKIDGFYSFKNVRLENLKYPLDIFFKVEQKSRRSKDECIIYMLVSKEEGVFISQGTDEPGFTAAKKFLNGFVDEAVAYKLSLDIKDQEEVVREAEKKLDKLEDNEKDINKKIEQLQKDLKRNQDDQQDQQKAVEKEKKKLNALKSQADN